MSQLNIDSLLHLLAEGLNFLPSKGSCWAEKCNSIAISFLYLWSTLPVQQVRVWLLMDFIDLVVIE